MIRKERNAAPLIGSSLLEPPQQEGTRSAGEELRRMHSTFAIIADHCVIA